jgi:CarboxypepD_reg-like domain
MSNRYKNSTTYSASDIEKYLKGELSAREMNELEQAALEDPFLGDALEGMATNAAALNQANGSSGSMLDADLAELRNRLTARTMTNEEGQAGSPTSTPSSTAAEDEPAGQFGPGDRIHPFPRRLAVAATLILLLGLGLLTYFTLRTGTHSQTVLAKTDRSAPEATASKSAQEPPVSQQALDTTSSKPPTPNTTATAPLTAAPPAASQATTPSLADSTTQLLTEKKDLVSKEAFKAKSSASQARTSAASASSAWTSDSNASRARASGDVASAAQYKFLPGLATTPVYRTKPGLRPDTLALQNKLGFFDKSTGNAFISRQLDNSLVFRGIVLDQQDHPLAGASLYLKGDPNIGTTTDQEGQFKLQLRPQDSTRQLMVSLIGYKEANLALNIINTDGPAGNVIRMQPHSPSLDEVVVVGYGAQRKETLAAAPGASDERLDSLWLTASPVVGRVAYRQYLDSAKKTLSLDPAITGTEAVSFEVDRNGALTSFKIEQSLSPAHDAGLIRLVTEGPAWRLSRGRKVRAVVGVSF